MEIENQRIEEIEKNLKDFLGIHFLQRKDLKFSSNSLCEYILPGRYGPKENRIVTYGDIRIYKNNERPENLDIILTLESYYKNPDIFKTYFLYSFNFLAKNTGKLNQSTQFYLINSESVTESKMRIKYILENLGPSALSSSALGSPSALGAPSVLGSKKIANSLIYLINYFSKIKEGTKFSFNKILTLYHLLTNI